MLVTNLECLLLTGEAAFDAGKHIATDTPIQRLYMCVCVCVYSVYVSVCVK
jgi:hypothetical protein